MRQIAIISVLVALLAGCSQGDVLDDVRRQGIGFESFVSKTSRGVPLAGQFEAGATMSVWGYTTPQPLTSAPNGLPADAAPIALLDGAGATVRLGVDGVWDYSPKASWTPGACHTFFAVAPATPQVACDRAVMTYSHPQDVAAQQDLMVAEPVWGAAPSVTGSHSAVSLRFRHALTMIRVAAVVVEKAGKSNIRVTGVRIYPKSSTMGFASRGQVDMAAQGSGPIVWTLLEQGVSQYVVTPANSVDAGFDRDAKMYAEIFHDVQKSTLMIIPQAATDVCFDVGLSYLDTDGVTKSATQTFEVTGAQAWTANAIFAYKFRIDMAKALNMKVVTFAPTIDNSWGEGAGTDIYDPDDSGGEAPPEPDW